MTFAVLAGLQLVNRLCLVASALAAERGGYVASAVLAVISSGTWVADRALFTFYRNRTEHRLAIEAIRHVLGGDPFLGASRRHYDTLLGGIFESAKVVAQVRPALAADVLAACAVSALAASKGFGATLVVFLLGMGAGFFALVALRQRIEAASMRAWELRERYGQQILDGLEGSHEIITALGPGEYENKVGRSLQEQRRSSWVLALESLVVGRAPLAAGLLAAFGLAYFVMGFHGLHRVGQWAVLASMLPPFGGLASSVAMYIEAKAPIDAVRGLLDRPLRSYGTASPERLSPIVLEGVRVDYGASPALHGVTGSFSGLVGVRGANGSGKSTLLRVLAGLMVPSAGTFTLGSAGHATIDWPRVRRRIAYLPQKPYFPPASTVRDALRFLLGEVEDSLLRSRLEQIGVWGVLEEKDGGDPLGTPIDQLSAGERQRVALARALGRSAELYLLDEPDANLDRAGIERLAGIVRSLATEATVIVAAHDTVLLEHVDALFRFEHGALFPEPLHRGELVGMGREHQAGE